MVELELNPEFEAREITANADVGPVRYEGGGAPVIVDSEIDPESSNPVENRAIAEALAGKGTYSKPASGIPKGHLAADVQTSLGKADTALQTAPVTSVNGQMGDVVVSMATDAQVEAAVDDYLEDHPTVGGVFSNAAKHALISLLEKVAYIDEDGQEYLDTLEQELFAVAVASITAVYTQSETVYDTDSLDVLRDDLVVTANYVDGTSETVTGYELSGTLTVGTSTVTVSYEGKTDTFTVTVESAFHSQYTEYDYVQVKDSTSGNKYAIGQCMMLKQYENLNVLSVELAAKPLTGISSGAAIIGRRAAGTSDASKSFGLYEKTGLLSWQLHGSTPASDAYRPVLNKDAVNTIYYQNTSVSPSSIRTNNNSPISVAWTNNNVLNLAPMLFGNPSGNGTSGGAGSVNISLTIKCQFGYAKYFDLSGNLVSHYVPAVRISDSRIGMYDLVENEFYTTTDATVSTEGASECIYEVGNWS